MDDFVERSLEREIIPDVLIESINDMNRAKQPEAENQKYRLPSDKYLSEAIGFDSLPDNIPFDSNEYKFILLFP